jgi:hypothetical protein
MHLHVNVLRKQELEADRRHLFAAHHGQAL